MKRLKLSHLKPLTLIAAGVFLGRAAQADTILTFDGIGGTFLTTFGSGVSSSGTGIVVNNGFNNTATPDINLFWAANAPVTGILSDPVQFKYNTGGQWGAGVAELFNSAAPFASGNGNINSLTFTPTAGSAVRLNSFNFLPYYTSGGTEIFNYIVNIMDGATILSSQSFSFGEGANQAVDLNYTGNFNEALTLDILRVGPDSTGSEPGGGPGAFSTAYNNAINDVSFSEITPVPEPSTYALFTGGLLSLTFLNRQRLARRNNQNAV